jgi:cytochrome P450
MRVVILRGCREIVRELHRCCDQREYVYQSSSRFYGKLTSLSSALRLFPPANIIPKHTGPGGPHVLRYNNREIRVPSNTTFNILAPSTHQNPKYWPHKKSSYHSGNDLDEFKPERWFSSFADKLHQTDSGVELGSDPDDRSPTVKFFLPKKGAFIPYSIGQRECMGKRFAQIEMLVVMAVIFRDWSVELVVDGEEGFSGGEKIAAWEKTRDVARGHLMNGMEHYMTMQLKKGLVPLRVVRRGSERVL